MVNFSQRRRILRGLFVVVAFVSAGFFVLYYFHRSVFLKLFPAPESERVFLSGSKVSGTVIDGKGAWFNDGKLTELVIRSEKTNAGWDVPKNIELRNFRLRGSIRIMGMGRNGEDEMVRLSSITRGHTERAQMAAPSDILLSGWEIEADHRIPLYLAPGVTRVRVEHCRFSGWSVSTAIYLDAESADNVITGNRFEVRAGRELIAVDGSARNRIEGNEFIDPALGGIYLYRNCGEGGTVRHQTPHGNTIFRNVFEIGSLLKAPCAIWLGSRNGGRIYCECDAGYDFGSSSDNGDFADRNFVSGNRFTPEGSHLIRDDGSNNIIDP